MHDTSSPRGIFVTGTGTDVGKSIVTAALNRALWQDHHTSFQGYLALKPVQTGTVSHLDNVQVTKELEMQSLCKMQGLHGDSALYFNALDGIKIPNIFVPRTLHHFELAASPHLAAQDENFRLSVQDIFDEIIQCYNAVQHNPMLIEGAGGVCVPFNEFETSLDLMQKLNMPVLLVVHNALGALNHTLLSIDALHARGLTIAAIVFTDKKVITKNSVIEVDNIKYVSQYKPNIPIYHLPYIMGLNNKQTMLQAFNNAARSLAALAVQLVSTWQSIPNEKNHATPSLLEFDKKHLWHPYTSCIDPLPAYEVSHAKGMHIFLRQKKEPLIDGMASWWCAVHGYGNEQLIRAAKKQADQMSHIMFGGLTHEPAVQATKKLLDLLPSSQQNPKRLERVFWSDSGSVAVEVALKMALQYQQGRGQTERTVFLSPRGGYYGDTQGAMSVCDPVNGMHTLFNKVLTKHIFIQRPSCAFDGSMSNEFDEQSLKPLKEAFAEHGHKLAAVIIEPIVQGAGGMWFYDPRYLKTLQKLCIAYDVLLIFDEIATGFGRTGKMFAAQWANITPDICCLGKALTGGFMTLAATICTEQVAQNICKNNHVFMHGPTFMANALACAVACASLDIFATNNWQKQVLRIEKELQHGLAPCSDLAGVAQVRVLGAIGVVEMQSNVNVAALQEFFVRQNVWIRPFSNLIYIMPPYIASSAQIQHLTKAITMAIECGAYEL